MEILTSERKDGLSHNFIVMELSDVDFLNDQKRALSTLTLIAMEEGGWSESKFKDAVILHMIGTVICNNSIQGREFNAQSFNELHDYFSKKLKIKFTQKRPDGKGGINVYYDLNLLDWNYY
tara:strand:+ start:23293 stop:23655 length:363 start_codon:yes stop_codon:yes gene_type:complete